MERKWLFQGDKWVGQRQSWGQQRGNPAWFSLGSLGPQRPRQLGPYRKERRFLS